MLTLNDQNFGKEILGSQKTALVDYYADWCPPCRMLSPILEKLSKEYKDKVIFAKIDVDLNPITSQKYGITNLPTVVLFKNGKPVSGFVGAKTEEEIKEWITGILGTNEEEEEEGVGGVRQNVKCQMSNVKKEEKEGIAETRESVDKLIEEYEKYAEENGYKLNPNKRMAEVVIKGLLKRKEKFGFRYCPCRQPIGDKEKDKKIICPCFYHKEEIKRDGHCLCGLFFK